MAAKFTDYGLCFMMETFFKGNTQQANFKLILYCLPSGEPADAADLTEAIGGGYARVAVARADITVNSDSSNFPSDKPTLSIVAKTFPSSSTKFTGPLTTNTTVVGWALVNGNEAENTPVRQEDIIMVGSLATPFIPALNNSLTLTITAEMGNGTPT